MDKFIAAVAALFIIVGCIPSNPRRQTMPSTSEPHIQRCHDDRIWDLGTGKLEEVGLDFQELNDLISTEFFSATEFKGVKLVSLGNYRYEFVATASTPPRDVGGAYVYRSKNGQPQVLVATSACPHIKAEVICGKPRTIEVDGTVPCLRGRRGPFLLSGPPSYKWVPIKSGIPVAFSDDVGIPTLEIRAEKETLPFMTGTVNVEAYDGATPQILLALLDLDEQKAASSAFLHMDIEYKSMKLETELNRKRLASAKRALRNAKDANQLADFADDFLSVQSFAYEELSAMVGTRLINEFRAIAKQGTREQLWPGLRLLKHVIGIDEPAEVEFEKRYGPMILEGAFPEDEVSMFRRYFENRSESIALLAKKEEADEAERIRQKRIGELWYDLEDMGDEIVGIRDRLLWLQKYGSGTPRELRGMRLMRIHNEEGRLQNQFCPMKRELLEIMSASEYHALYQEHCENEPPRGWVIGVGEVTPLTEECKQVFTTGC